MDWKAVCRLASAATGRGLTLSAALPENAEHGRFAGSGRWPVWGALPCPVPFAVVSIPPSHLARRDDGDRWPAGGLANGGRALPAATADDGVDRGAGWEF